MAVSWPSPSDWYESMTDKHFCLWEMCPLSISWEKTAWLGSYTSKFLKYQGKETLKKWKLLNLIIGHKKPQPNHRTKNPARTLQKYFQKQSKKPSPFSQCLKSKKQGTGKHQLERDSLQREQNSYVPILDREDLKRISETLKTCPRNRWRGCAITGRSPLGGWHFPMEPCTIQERTGSL